MKENRTLEFKETVTNMFLKTVSAFANYHDGQIIFGVNDAGKITGIEDIVQTSLDIENKINDSIRPQPEYDIKDGEDGTIVLTVYAGSAKPYMYKSKAYKRNDTATIEVDNIELTRLILEGSNRNYEELPSLDHAFTFKVLEEKLANVAGVESCDLNVLKTLNLYSDKDGFNIAAELLADTNRYPGIDVGKFGESISIIQKRKTFENISILSVYDAVYEMYRDYYQYEVIEGAFRETKASIPDAAFREAVANALIHRVWDVKDQIRVLMFDDKIEIHSPGGLLPGLSEEEYLAGSYSKLRNPIISNVFYRLKIVEIFGTGIRRIKEAYKNSISQPAFEIFDNSIKVTLPVVKEITSLSFDEAMVYNLLSKETGASIGAIMEKVPFGKSKIRKVLQSLIVQEYISVTGNGRGTRYYKR